MVVTILKTLKSGRFNTKNEPFSGTISPSLCPIVYGCIIKVQMVMNVNIKTLSSAILIGLTSTTSSMCFAMTEHQAVTARYVNVVQEKQAKSIEQGEIAGKLTPKEARRLRAEQHDINQLEREMRANGSLDAAELKVLFQRLEASRKHINKLLRNGISTYGRPISG